MLLSGSKVLRLLEPMHAVCVTRHEGYWSYEFCYKKGLRQFHTVAMRDSKGAPLLCLEVERSRQLLYGLAVVIHSSQVGVSAATLMQVKTVAMRDSKGSSRWL